MIGWSFFTWILLIFGVFSAWFFRDPERLAPTRDDAVVSPADGRVIIVEKVHDDRFLQGPAVKISIFMNLFNVHVNRVPYSGQVQDVLYFPGKFFSADLDKASRDNEHNAVIVNMDRGSMAVVQIAGLIARRIACWIKPEDRLVRGQRFGLIRFGSRLDVYLPPDFKPEVQLQQKVRAGETILGYLP